MSLNTKNPFETTEEAANPRVRKAAILAGRVAATVAFGAVVYNISPVANAVHAVVQGVENFGQNPDPGSVNINLIQDELNTFGNQQEISSLNPLAPTNTDLAKQLPAPDQLLPVPNAYDPSLPANAPYNPSVGLGGAATPASH